MKEIKGKKMEWRKKTIRDKSLGEDNARDLVPFSKSILCAPYGPFSPIIFLTTNQHQARQPLQAPSPTTQLSFLSIPCPFISSPNLPLPSFHMPILLSSWLLSLIWPNRFSMSPLFLSHCLIKSQTKKKITEPFREFKMHKMKQFFFFY